MSVNINLRVFRRSEEDIIIFWNTEGLIEEQKKNAKIYLMEKQKEGDEGELVNKEIKELQFIMTDDTKEFKTAKGVAIGIIKHGENQVDKEESILIRLVLGLTSKTESYLRISPFGVLPNFERDNKKQHVQLMAYVKQKKRWAKVPMVKAKDGSYAIAVKIVE
jgi:hypothetical protein